MNWASFLPDFKSPKALVPYHLVPALIGHMDKLSLERFTQALSQVGAEQEGGPPSVQGSECDICVCRRRKRLVAAGAGAVPLS